MGTLFQAGTLSTPRPRWACYATSRPIALRSHSVYAEYRATHCTPSWDSLKFPALPELHENHSSMSKMLGKSDSLP